MPAVTATFSIRWSAPCASMRTSRTSGLSWEIGDRLMYDEQMVGPMRAELTRLGIEETRTAEEVDAVLGEKKGTVPVVVNPVCGCAAGMARPAVALALKHDVRPGKMITVFAGNDRERTTRAP